jgi:hypothetical protein
MIGAAMTLFQKNRLSARAAMLLEAAEGLARTSASACKIWRISREQHDMSESWRLLTHC